MIPVGRARCFFGGETWEAAHRRASAFAASNQIRGEIRIHPTEPEQGG